MITTVKLINISMSSQNDYLLSGKSPSEDLSEVAQSCLTLCDPTQSETLEVGAITCFMQPCRDCPGGAVDKNLPLDVGDMDLIPGLGRFLIPGASKPVCHSY